MNRWGIFLILILMNNADEICHYLIRTTDQTLDVCLSDQCHRFVDPYSILVKPNNCKTKDFSLKFSNYKNYFRFLKRMEWKLSDLFSSKITNEIRLLKIYIENLDVDDQLIDQNHFLRLGNQIDLYQLYLLNLNQNHSLYPLRHYQPNEPQWDIIQIQFNCHSFVRIDEYSCSTHILPPSFLSPRRPLIITTTNIISSSSSLSIEQTKKEDFKLNHLIILIIIPFLILLILMFIYIIMIRNRLVNKAETDQCSSIVSISHQLDTNQGSFSRFIPIAQPYQISRLPSPHKDSLYKETEKDF